MAAGRYPLQSYPNFIPAIINGLSHVLDPRTGERNRWASCSLQEMARAIHVEAGRNPDSMSRNDQLLFRERPRDAPYIAASATTSDFPSVVGAAILQTASTLYDLAPPTLRRIAARRDRANFLPGFATRTARAALAELQEGSEIPVGTLAERSEAAKLRTFAWRITLSRQLLLSDAHNLLRDAVRGAVDAATAIEDDMLFAGLSANSFAGQTMADGQTLFHATHSNTGTGAISATSLAAGYAALLGQKDAGGAHFVASEPRYLVCGPSAIVGARATLATLTSGGPGEIEIVPEPRLGSNDSWYLAADPERCAGLEYGSLAASPRPQLQLAPVWQVDGLQFKIVHDVGAWAADWRPLWRSTGV